MKLSNMWWLLVAAIFLFVACGDDDDDNGGNGDYTGPNYRVSANLEVSDSKSDDDLTVEVKRLNPDAPTPDNASISIDGVSFVMSGHDPFNDIATYETDEVGLNPSSTHLFRFRCGSDSVETDFTTPPITLVNITAPVRTNDSLLGPDFNAGDEIPVVWEYDGATPPFVLVGLDGMVSGDLLSYRARFDGTTTTHTIPGDTTANYPGAVMPIIFVWPTEYTEIESESIELEISSTAYPAMLPIVIHDPDPDSFATPTITVTHTPTSATFDWDPPNGAMMLTIARNTDNTGFGYTTGNIWTISTDSEYEMMDGIVPPVTFGIVPSGGQLISGPDEELTAGENYSVVVSWYIHPDNGTVGGKDWDH